MPTAAPSGGHARPYNTAERIRTGGSRGQRDAVIGPGRALWQSDARRLRLNLGSFVIAPEPRTRPAGGGPVGLHNAAASARRGVVRARPGRIHGHQDGPGRLLSESGYEAPGATAPGPGLPPLARPAAAPGPETCKWIPGANGTGTPARKPTPRRPGPSRMTALQPARSSMPTMQRSLGPGAATNQAEPAARPA